MKISGTEVELIPASDGQSFAPVDCDYEISIPTLVIKGVWNDDIVDVMVEENIKGLNLNFSKGFKCEDFSFLSRVPQLELLNILYTPIESISEVEKLTELRSLSISCHWKKKINLAPLKRLERCYIHYGNGAESVFECESLKYLYIDGFKLKNFDSLKNLENIKSLTIANTSFNQPEILPELEGLRKLSLLNCRKLDHLDGVGQLSHLEWLNIDGSGKLADIRELASLSNLMILQLSNNKEIDSLSPISQLRQLKSLAFFGSTVFKDGDFSFLENFPDLSLVGFSGRKHYTHKPLKRWNWNNYESREVGIIRK